MIDKLVMRCPFLSEHVPLDLRKLQIPLKGDARLMREEDQLVKTGGIEINNGVDHPMRIASLYHAWDKLPSSYHHLAFKVNEGVISKDGIDYDRPYIEINASPAYIMQGHNVFGSDSLYDCAMAMFTVLYEALPTLCSMLDPQYWEVIKMDITYSAKAKSLLHAQQFIEAMRQVSVGQLKPSNKNHYDSTCYWNNGSRARSLKLYEKSQEVMQHLKTLKRQGQVRAVEAHTPDVIEWSKGRVRWEATLRTRWFKDHSLPTRLVDLIKVFEPIKLWKLATSEIRQALEGQTMRHITDERVHHSLRKQFATTTRKGNLSYAKADAAYSTYLHIKHGGLAAARQCTSNGAYYRHLDMLRAIGLSGAYLRTMQTNQGNVVPMIQYINVDFDEQIPQFAKTA